MKRIFLENLRSFGRFMALRTEPFQMNECLCHSNVDGSLIFLGADWSLYLRPLGDGVMLAWKPDMPDHPWPVNTDLPGSVPHWARLAMDTIERSVAKWAA